MDYRNFKLGNKSFTIERSEIASAIVSIVERDVAQASEKWLRARNMAYAFREGLIFTDKKTGKRDWFGYLAAIREIE